MNHRTIFLRDNKAGSALIRAFDGWRQWSHCAGILADGEHVIEALAFNGVVVTPLEDVMRRATEYVIVEKQVYDKADGDRWALSTRGKAYDWLGAGSVPWSRDWQHPDKWFCSEHAVMWEAMAGNPIFRKETRGVSPNTYYSVL